jgi:hypothetical protein
MVLSPAIYKVNIEIQICSHTRFLRSYKQTEKSSVSYLNVKREVMFAEKVMFLPECNDWVLLEGRARAEESDN